MSRQQFPVVAKEFVRQMQGWWVSEMEGKGLKLKVVYFQQAGDSKAFCVEFTENTGGITPTTDVNPQMIRDMTTRIKNKHLDSVKTMQSANAALWMATYN